MYMFRDILFPDGIKLSENDPNEINIHIKNPQKNMQTDDAAFESWALILRSRGGEKVVLSYAFPATWDLIDTLKSPGDNEKQHFMRFLFRLWKFQESMDWFDVMPGNCSEILNQFIVLFKGRKLVNNVPNSRAKLNTSSKKKEHIIESIFTRENNAKKYIRDIDAPLLPNELYNQLPCGLFEDTVANVNRVFPTGFFDLWGVDQNNELWLFELKDPDNQKAGIISELFFYANYASYVFQSSTYNRNVNKEDRGYGELLRAASEGIDKIHACFLSPSYHKEISESREELRTALNAGQDIINYSFLEYDYDALVNDHSRELLRND